MTPRELARLATAVENGAPLPVDLPEGDGLIVGVTGPPGAGKSSLVDALTAELRVRLLRLHPNGLFNVLRSKLSWGAQ